MKVKVMITLLTIIGYLPAFGSYYSCEDENKTDIILEKGTEDDESKHARIPIYIPLTCYYMQGHIYLNTLEDLGEITITITNLETGELWESIYNSDYGLISIPTSSTNGNYMVRIVASNNDSYFGYYTL